MCKKLLLFTAVVVLLLGFVGQATADSLTAHWKFDGDPNDSTANNNHGTIYGDPNYVDGALVGGQALDFNGLGDYIQVPDDVSMSFDTGSFSIAFWIKATVGGQIVHNGSSGGGSSGKRYCVYLSGGDIQFDIDDNSTKQDLANAADLTAGVWYHVVCYRDVEGRDGIAGATYVYYNGEQVGSKTNSICSGDINSPGEPLYIGRRAPDETTNYFDGQLDDIRLYDYALSRSDINDLAHPYAWEPDPGDGDTGIQSTAKLYWEPGTLSDDFDVYFGTSFDDVNDANTTVDPNNVYKGPQDANSFDPNDPTASDLLADKDYYWRIDSNDTGVGVKTGAVWHFKTAPSDASAPIPFDGAKYVPTDANVLWTAGNGATSHDVYFGIDFDDVNDANTAIDPNNVYKGNKGVTEYDPNDPTANDLLVDTDYYWRIDEISGATTFKGEVWSFTTAPDPAGDPNLVMHLKLDEGQGDYTYDASGNDNVGTRVGDPEGPVWITNGIRNGALDFDGANDYVEVPDDSSIDFNGSFSIALWLKTTSISNEERVLIKGSNEAGVGPPATSGKRYEIYGGSGTGNLWFRLDDAGTKKGVQSGDVFNTGEWIHGVFTYEPAEGMSIYVNGQFHRNNSITIGNFDSPGEPLLIGRHDPTNSMGAFYKGMLDDIRLYKERISDDLITELARTDFSHAWDESPDSNSTNVRQNTKLSWKVGKDPYDDADAVKHDVYFGTDYNDVNEATITDPCGVYMETVTAASWDTDANYPSGLAWNTTYYWRIDEVNDTPGVFAKGYIWKFKTADFIIVDDMELYGNSPDPNEVWKDGTKAPWWVGSEVTLGTPPFIHGGSQSLKFFYENSGDANFPLLYDHTSESYSEIEASTTGANSLDCGSDWTRDDSKAMTLYFYGNLGNDVLGDANTMYVVIEDGDGSDANAMIKYGDYADEDVNDLKEDSWHEWNIALDDFNTPNDVNLANIAKVYIGFGIRGEPNDGTSGGNGTVYFDNIRLNKSRCIALYDPNVDLNGDCDIDSLDVRIMAGAWLAQDHNVAAVNPTDANLVAHYKFEDNADDSAGGVPDQNGIEYGSPSYTTEGKFTKAISFDGENDCVVVKDVNATIDAEFSTGPFTIALWLKSSNDSLKERVLCNGTEGGAQWDLQDSNDQQTGKRYELYFENNNTFNFAIDDANGTAKSQITTLNTDYATGEWVHVAAVRDTNSNELILYCDGFRDTGIGEDWDGNDVSGDINSPNEPLVFGAQPVDVNEGVYSFRDFMTGQLDDVRLYKQALSEGEVVYLVNDGKDLNHPITSPANLVDPEPMQQRRVNLIDYAVLADAWLDDYRWP